MDPIHRHKLDVRGAMLPFMLLHVSQLFRSIPVGDVIEVCWSDPEPPDDVFKILPQNAYELLSMETVDAEAHCYRMSIVKKRSEFDAIG
jgi:TusA-related sulfurtransferase